MNKGVLAILVILLVLAGFFIFRGFQNSENEMAKGRVVFGITDAAASLSNIQSVTVEVNKLEVHSMAEGEGWVSVSTRANEFDLLRLRQSGDVALLADADLDAGVFDRVRVSVDKVLVTKAGETSEVKLISREFNFPARLVVEKDMTSTVILDFILDGSLHSTVKDEFVFAPVIKVETRSQTEADVAAGGKVSVSGGKVDESSMIGMDQSGRMGANLSLDGQTKIELLGNIIKLIPQGKSETGAKVNADAAIQAALDSNNIDTAISTTLTSTSEGNLIWEVSGTDGLEVKKVLIDATSGAILEVK